MNSNAVSGAVITHARTFTIATAPTASSPTAIVAGGYSLHAAGVGCWVRLGAAATNGDAVSAQPAAANGLLWVEPGIATPLDVLADTTISAITPSGSGSLRIVGPLRRAGDR